MPSSNSYTPLTTPGYHPYIICILSLFGFPHEPRALRTQRLDFAVSTSPVTTSLLASFINIIVVAASSLPFPPPIRTTLSGGLTPSARSIAEFVANRKIPRAGCLPTPITWLVPNNNPQWRDSADSRSHVIPPFPCETHPDRTCFSASFQISHQNAVPLGRNGPIARISGGR